MTARRVDSSRGWEWIVEGWRLFMKAPGLWIVMLLIYVIIGILLSFIPLLGSLAYTLAMPALMGGMLYGAAVLSQGGQLEIPHLFRAFQDQDRLGPMLVLGVLLLVAYIVMALVVGGAMVGWMAGTGMTHMNEDIAVNMAMRVGPVVILLILLICLAIAMGMFYAIPLVMLASKSPWQSIQESFSACLLNMLPLLVFGLIYLILTFVAALPMGLGFLVLGPVTFGAIYASYKDIFPDEAMPRVAEFPSLSKD